jgi:FkbM family methyltransferase
MKGRTARQTALERLGRVVRGLSWFVESPDLVPLYLLRGVPPRLAASLDHPWLRELGIATVLDVGANTGQFALAARRAFPAAEIVSVEPLAECYATLTRRLRGLPRTRALNVALGESPGSARFERNEYTPSSSFLPLGEAHRASFPFARATTEVEVPIDTLDAVVARLGLPTPLLIKIDVQGYEDRVLRGATAALRTASALIVETSFVPLYEGQLCHDGICALLSEHGFRYAGCLDQLVEPGSARILSADSVFLR